MDLDVGKLWDASSTCRSQIIFSTSTAPEIMDVGPLRFCSNRDTLLQWENDHFTATTFVSNHTHLWFSNISPTVDSYGSIINVVVNLKSFFTITKTDTI